MGHEAREAGATLGPGCMYIWMTSGGILEVDAPPLVFCTFLRFRHFPKWIITTDQCTKKALKSIDLDELSSSRYISSTDSVTKKSQRHFIFFGQNFLHTFYPLRKCKTTFVKKFGLRRQLFHRPVWVKMVFLNRSHIYLSIREVFRK